MTLYMNYNSVLYVHKNLCVCLTAVYSAVARDWDLNATWMISPPGTSWHMVARADEPLVREIIALIEVRRQAEFT